MTIKILEVLVLSCLVAEALLLIYLAVSARRFVRKMTEGPKQGKPVKKIFIDSALSMDL